MKSYRKAKNTFMRYPRASSLDTASSSFRSIAALMRLRLLIDPRSIQLVKFVNIRLGVAADLAEQDPDYIEAASTCRYVIFRRHANAKFRSVRCVVAQLHRSLVQLLDANLVATRKLKRGADLD